TEEPAMALLSPLLVALVTHLPALGVEPPDRPPPAPGDGPGTAAGAREPGGLLGHPLGSYLTVEGVRAEQGKVGVRTLLVDSINGRRLPKPVALWVENLDLPPQQRCTLKGYETGRMIGTPPAVFEAAREQGTAVGAPQAA